MRRPLLAPVMVLTAALSVDGLTGGAAWGAGPAAAAPLTLENAVPLAVPLPPRFKTPALPPAPKPLETPELMATPPTPQLATPAPVAAPANPTGAPPVPARLATPRPVPVPAGPGPASGSGPGIPGPSASERLAAAPPAINTPATAPVAAIRPLPAEPARPLPAEPARPLPAGPLRVGFAAGSADLPDAAEPLLAAVAEQMRAVATRRLQLRAYAAGDVDSDRQARQLSLKRAVAVRERLTALGVRSTRIDLRPLGAALPPDGGGGSDRDRVDLEFTSD